MTGPDFQTVPADHCTQQERVSEHKDSALEKVVITSENASRVMSPASTELTCLQLRDASTSDSGSDNFKSIQDLPVEILQLIAAKVGSGPSARAFCNTSKKIREKVAPECYKELTLIASDGRTKQRLHPAFYQQFAHGLVDRTLCESIKHLHISAPFRDELKLKCQHSPHTDVYLGCPSKIDMDFWFSEDLGIGIILLLREIPDGQLRSFRYFPIPKKSRIFN